MCADDELGQSSDLRKEALFISSSSLSDHVPIGKGKCYRCVCVCVCVCMCVCVWLWFNDLYG